MPEMNLKDAIRKVLQEATERLHYRVISDIIASEGLAQNMGATPDKSVASELSRMIMDGEPIKRLGDGYYAWRCPRPAEADREDEEDDADDDKVSIAAYGLYWERDRVEWDVSRLLGRQNRVSTPVDFADQQGVYLLHHMRTVIYVGRTSAQNNGLFGRLRSHTKSDRRSGRWDRFSWFGVRPVDENGVLLAPRCELNTDQLIAILEAVLIETHLPPFNDKSGDLMGELYQQVIIR